MAACSRVAVVWLSVAVNHPLTPPMNCTETERPSRAPSVPLTMVTVSVTGGPPTVATGATEVEETAKVGSTEINFESCSHPRADKTTPIRNGRGKDGRNIGDSALEVGGRVV